MLICINISSIKSYQFSALVPQFDTIFIFFSVFLVSLLFFFAAEIFIADLSKMPHLLMAGATGQGKSVGVNALLISLLYKKHPSQIKFVLIDPSTTEYNSFIFDIAKLNQDLICKWFIRNKNCNLDKKLHQISESLNKYSFYNNNYLLILMLMRILPYSKNVEDKKFLYKNIIDLWNY